MIPKITWNESAEELEQLLTKIEERCSEIQEELKKVPTCWTGDDGSHCKQRKELESEMWTITNRAITAQRFLEEKLKK